MEPSQLQGSHPDSAATTLQDSNPQPERRKQKRSSDTATAGSPPQPKKRTCSGKSSACSSATQATSSSPTPAQASTSDAKASKPFFDARCEERSKKLWLPTETGCADLPSNWSSGSFESTESGSWFAMQQWQHRRPSWQKTCLPSFRCSAAGSTEGGSTAEEPKAASKKRKKDKKLATAARAIRIFPIRRDRETLRQWMGCYRVTYNRALDLSKRSKRKDYNFLRNAVVTNENVPEPWLRDCPGAIRKYAVRDLAAAYNSNFAKRRKDVSHKFDLKYKSKKDRKQSIKVEHKDIKISGSSLTMYPTKMSAMRIYARSLPSRTIDYDVTLSMDRLGRFYIHVPFVRDPENQGATDRGTCSVDPGIRTFVTTWDPEGGCYKLGHGAIGRLIRLALHLDKLLAKISNTKKLKRRRRMRRAADRMRKRMKNLVAELHWKTAAFLCKNYETVLLPEFKTQGMVGRLNRKINSKTTRSMLTLSHYSFRQRLLHKASLSGTTVHVVGEEYTSKTCSNCGWLHDRLGGSKVFCCQRCGLKGDRDGLAARNIFLKNIMFT